MVRVSYIRCLRTQYSPLKDIGLMTTEEISSGGELRVSPTKVQSKYKNMETHRRRQSVPREPKTDT